MWAWSSSGLAGVYVPSQVRAGLFSAGGVLAGGLFTAVRLVHRYTPLVGCSLHRYIYSAGGLFSTVRLGHRYTPLVGCSLL